MDGSKKPVAASSSWNIFIRIVGYVPGVGICIIVAVLLLPRELGDLDYAERLLLFVLLLMPLVQFSRVPILRRLLPAEQWGKRAENTAGTDWFISLFSGALMAFPLVNLAIRGGYTGSVLITPQWKGYWYGQFWIGNHEIGIPDYFAALLLAVIGDVLVLWAFALFHKPAFKPSLRAALIVNAAIYIPVTLLFLTPYFFRKLGW